MDFANPDIDPETYAPNDAFGILAQSIGGGGGSGGSSVANEPVAAVPTGEGASGAFTFSAAVGGNGGRGGDAGPAGDTDRPRVVWGRVRQHGEFTGVAVALNNKI